MQRIISTLMLFVFMTLLPAGPVQAWFFGDNTLVTIDGTDYTTEDFKRWWRFWKDEGSPLPETPEVYIDWLLLAREGRTMELDSDPGFERATRIFLQSRALLKLKYEAVDSQIEVTDAEVRKRYDAEYVPRWGLEGMEFKDKAAAAAVRQELVDGSATVESILERPQESGGPLNTAEMWLRPKDFAKNEKWDNFYRDLSVGDVVDPDKIGESAVLWYLKEVKDADDEDFAQLREDLSKKMRKDREAVLTRALIRDLREKYEVKIDQERIDAIDLNADDASFTDALVITSTQQNISEKDFVAMMRRVMRARPMLVGALRDEEAGRLLKNDTAYNIIAQSVTNWESLDRHYEEKEPFKWEYEFNYNHRLGLSVQQRLFAEQAKISDDEIKQQYEQNKSRYSVPSRVKLYIVDENQGPIDKVWADTAAGTSIDKTLTKHMKDNYPGLQDVPANHLDPEVKPVVDKLAVGETSQIFTAQGVRVLVHLSERIPESAIPYERVKNSIHQELFEKKIIQLQESYLETVKAGLEIEIQQRQWQAVQKELGGA